MSFGRSLQGRERKLLQSLTEDIPFYSWVRSSEPPRYFNSGLFYHEAEANVVSDAERDFHSIDYCNKLQGLVKVHKQSPAPKKPVRLERVQAAKILQAWWRGIGNLPSSKHPELNEPSFSLEVQPSGLQGPKSEAAQKKGCSNQLNESNSSFSNLADCAGHHNDEALSSDFGVNIKDLSGAKSKSSLFSAQRTPRDIAVDECSRIVTPKDSIHDFSEQLRAQERLRKTPGQLSKSPYSFGYASNDNRGHAPLEFEPTAFQDKIDQAIISYSKKSSSKKDHLMLLLNSSSDPLPRDFNLEPEKAASVRQSFCLDDKSNGLEELKSKLDESIRLETLRKSHAGNHSMNDLLDTSDHLNKKLDFDSSIFTPASGQKFNPMTDTSAKALNTQDSTALSTVENSQQKLDFRKKSAVKNSFGEPKPSKQKETPGSLAKKEIRISKTKNQKEIEVVMVEEQESCKNTAKDASKNPRRTAISTKTATAAEAAGTSVSNIPLNKQPSAVKGAKPTRELAKDQAQKSNEEKLLAGSLKDKKAQPGSGAHSPKRYSRVTQTTDQDSVRVEDWQREARETAAEKRENAIDPDQRGEESLEKVDFGRGGPAGRELRRHAGAGLQRAAEGQGEQVSDQHV